MNAPQPRQAPDVTLEPVEQLSDAQVLDLHRMYQSEWWTKDRELDDVRRMLRCTDLIFGFSEPPGGRLVAFARVLTDYVYKAVVFDVIVDTSHRRAGLGRALMDAIMGHPRLARVKHIELYCLPELVPYYKRWGFTTDLGHLRFMRRSL